MTNKEIIAGCIFILMGAFNVAITYFNGKRFIKLCDSYKEKYGLMPVGRSSIEYFDFSFAYTKVISTEKIIYIYFPIIFSKNYSWNKRDESGWYDFINNYSSSFKKWVVVEVTLTTIGFIFMLSIIGFHYLKS